MDTLAHALFALLLYKLNSIKKFVKSKINLYHFIFWTIFPDILAFSLLFIWAGFLFVYFGKLYVSFFPPTIFPPEPNGFQIYEITRFLYLIGHSIIIFSMVFFILSLIFRKIFWSLIGWFLHILIDIPTHSKEFFATKFLWPVSDLSFDGIAWRTPWFLIATYLFLVLAFTITYFLEKRSKNKKKFHPK